MYSANTATGSAATIAAVATTARTIAASATPLVHHPARHHSPRRWAMALAVLVLLLLALLSFAGATLGPQLPAAAEAARAQAVGSLGDLQGVLAGIRWVR